MTRQNRVLPTGEIVAAPFRGALTGNRGILHDAEGVGRARWRHKNWIACALAFRNRHRVVMTPGTWTELFFFDETVALAAGHRPCAECRRADYNRFRRAWADATDGVLPSASVMDAALHAARLDGRRQRRFESRLDDLPDGTFVMATDGAPSLLWRRRLHPYLHDRYGAARPAPARLTALTPSPTVAVLMAGYRPDARVAV